MDKLPHDLSIAVIAVAAVCFVLLGIFYPAITDRLGLDEGSSGHRLLSLLIGLMLFIIWDLARKSKAGRLGTFILFFVLAFGMLGFVAKSVIKWVLGI